MATKSEQDKAERSIPSPIAIQKCLGGVDYPADKETLIQTARKHGADEDIIETLNRLDMDRFNSPNDVSEAMGKLK